MVTRDTHNPMGFRKQINMNANTNTNPSDEHLDNLLRNATDADASVSDARLWASPAYVVEAQRHAEACWAVYLTASLLASATYVEKATR